MGGCEGSPDHPECGEGTQTQSRECTDGTNDICTPKDKERVVSCAVAGTALPKCSNVSYTLFCNFVFNLFKPLVLIISEYISISSFSSPSLRRRR